MYVCMYVCIYIYIYICVCVYEDTWVCSLTASKRAARHCVKVCVRIYVYMYICMYVCMYEDTWVCSLTTSRRACVKVCLCVNLYMRASRQADSKLNMFPPKTKQRCKRSFLRVMYIYIMYTVMYICMNTYT